ncbi:hypothetical protein SAMN04488026_108514 [Aliiruegeria lutimaris]|uniref:Uncharacterized protein n=1 Tax=Aliiruegeria lutimaris TaxID=571298 RepID=A0A1G9K1Z9_9RHOB|nr:hypothetical protein SAMN04488026_108514 [Aliiruegeria lutimaris]
MFWVAARFNVLIWGACTPYFFDKSASVISSRIASRGNLALNSGEWFFLFVILDRVSRQAIHHSNWSEPPRPPLCSMVLRISAMHLENILRNIKSEGRNLWHNRLQFGL